MADVLDFLPHPSHASVDPVGETHEYGPPYGEPGKEISEIIFHSAFLVRSNPGYGFLAASEHNPYFQ